MIQGSQNLQPTHPHLESAFWFVNLQNVVECSAAAYNVIGSDETAKDKRATQSRENDD